MSLILYSRSQDAVVHAACLRRDPRLERLNRRLADFDAARRDRIKTCAVCGKAITNPDDYLSLGYLGDDEVAAKWNYMDFHIRCLPLWTELPCLIRWTVWALEDGVWSEKGISWLSEQLKKATAY